ncbi:MAG: thiamine phosphate synthase [Bacteroidota bacterium]
MEKLQYISQETDRTHLQNIREACEAGVKWVQLRVKNQSTEHVTKMASEAREICQSFGATLIINDHPDVAASSRANGVHLGKKDPSPEEARKLVGTDRIIGGTANTFEDLVSLVRMGVDYIGLGPFRFTATKEKLSPVLGLAGYQSIMDRCKEAAIQVPVIAIGGIVPEDIPAIMKTGVSGIAIASLINHSTDKRKTVQELLNALQDE